MVNQEWEINLWWAFRRLQERKIKEVYRDGYSGENGVEEANRLINKMSNVELIDALSG